MGRAREVKKARALLAAGRLVTFIGVGGVGKTRLALRVASQVSHLFSDGVWLVELAELPADTDSTRVEQAVAEALGLRDFSVEHPREALVEHLRERHCLLVLDNCEHLVDEAGALVAYLLRASGELRVLATSREVVGCVGEHVLHVPPLGLPDPDDPDTDSEALQLLIQRAAAVGLEVTEANSAAAAELCRRLDGLPLAIELATGRLRALSIEDALERLEDRFQLLTGGPRHGPSAHRTLRRVMDWSYQLCSLPERLLWQRVSVFAGGFDLAAAEDVCAGAEIDRTDVLDLLTGLVRQSLLSVELRDGHTRYRMLDTLRQYGLRVLAEQGGDVELRRRHRDYFRRLAARAAQDWFSPRELDWLRWARAEMPNLRAAMDHGLTESDPLASLDIAVDLTRLRAWFFIGWPGEGRAWLERGLDQAHLLELDRSTRAELVHALAMAGWIGLCQGDADGAAELLGCCRKTLADGEDAPPALRFAESAYALVVEVDARSVDMLEGVLGTLRADGVAPADAAMVELMWAIAVGFLGDRDTALAASEQHLDNARQRGAVWQISWAQWAVGLARLRHGDHRRGLTAALESLRRQREMDDHWGTVWGIHEVAWALAARLTAARAGSPAEPNRQIADTIARVLGGAQQLRDWAGVRLVGLGPFRAITAHAADVACATLGERAYLESFEQGGFPGASRAQAYHCILALAGVRPTTPPAILDADVTEPRAERLSPREQQIAALIARGWTNPRIARELVISNRTVQTHVANILRKRGLRNRHELAVWHNQPHPPQH